MKHLKAVSRTAVPADGETTAVESIILLLMQVFFSNFYNISSVLQNLQKYYEKT
jgi:hypothetical protein